MPNYSAKELKDKGYLTLSEFAMQKGVAESDILFVITTGEEYKQTFFKTVKENDIYYFNPADLIDYDMIMDDFDEFYKEFIEKDDEIEPERFVSENEESKDTKNTSLTTEGTKDKANQFGDMNSHEDFSPKLKYVKRKTPKKITKQHNPTEYNKINSYISSKTVVEHRNDFDSQKKYDYPPNNSQSSKLNATPFEDALNKPIDTSSRLNVNSFNSQSNKSEYKSNTVKYSPFKEEKKNPAYTKHKSTENNYSQPQNDHQDSYMRKCAEYEEYQKYCEKIKSTDEWLEKLRKQHNDEINNIKNQITTNNEVVRGVNYTADNSKDYNKEESYNENKEKIDKIDSDTANNIIASYQKDNITYQEYTDGSFKYKNGDNFEITYDAKTGDRFESYKDENGKDIKVIDNGHFVNVETDDLSYEKDVAHQSVSSNINGDKVVFNQNGTFSTLNDGFILNYDENGYFKNGNVKIDNKNYFVNKNGDIFEKTPQSGFYSKKIQNSIMEANSIDLKIATNANLHNFLKKSVKTNASNYGQFIINNYKNSRKSIDHDMHNSNFVPYGNGGGGGGGNPPFPPNDPTKINKMKAVMNYRKNKRISFESAEQMSKNFYSSLIAGSDVHAGWRQLKDMTSVHFALQGVFVMYGLNYDKKRVFAKKFKRGDYNKALNVLKANGILKNLGNYKVNQQLFAKDFSYLANKFLIQKGYGNLMNMNSKELSKFLKRKGKSLDADTLTVVQALRDRRKYQATDKKNKNKKIKQLGAAFKSKIVSLAHDADAIQGYLMLEKVTKSFAKTGALAINIYRTLKSKYAARISKKANKILKSTNPLKPLTVRQKRILDKNKKIQDKANKKIDKKQKKIDKKNARKQKIKDRLNNTKTGKLFNRISNSKFGKIVKAPFKGIANVLGFISKGINLIDTFKQIIIGLIVKLGAILLVAYLVLNILVALISLIFGTFFPFLEDNSTENKYKSIVTTVENYDNSWYINLEKLEDTAPEEFVKENDKDTKLITGFYDLNTQSNESIESWGVIADGNNNIAIPGFHKTIVDMNGNKIEKVCNAETLVYMGYIYALDIGTEKIEDEIATKEAELEKKKVEVREELKKEQPNITGSELEKLVTDECKDDVEDIDELKEELNDDDELVDSGTLEDITLALHDYTHYITSSISDKYICNGCKRFEYECTDEEIKELNKQLAKTSNDARILDVDTKSNSKTPKGGTNNSKTLLIYNKNGCSTSKHIVENGVAKTVTTSSDNTQHKKEEGSIDNLEANSSNTNSKKYKGAKVTFNNESVYLDTIQGTKLYMQINDNCDDYKIIYNKQNTTNVDYSTYNWFTIGTGEIDYNKVPAFGFKYGNSYVGTVQYLIDKNVVNNTRTFTFTMSNGKSIEKIGSSENNSDSVCKFNDVFYGAILIGIETNNGIEYRALTQNDANVINILRKSATLQNLSFTFGGPYFKYYTFDTVEMDCGTFVCNGHDSCPGHIASYCTGHVTLNVTGHVINETKNKKNNVCTYVANCKDYDNEKFDVEGKFVQKDWNTSFSHLKSLLKNDWEELYGFSIRKTWSSIASDNADLTVIEDYMRKVLAYGSHKQGMITCYTLGDDRYSFVENCITFHYNTINSNKTVFKYDSTANTYSASNNTIKKISSKAFTNYLMDKFIAHSGNSLATSIVSVDIDDLQAGDIVYTPGTDNYAVILYRDESIDDVFTVLRVSASSVDQYDNTDMEIVQAKVGEGGFYTECYKASVLSGPIEIPYDTY